MYTVYNHQGKIIAEAESIEAAFDALIEKEGEMKCCSEKGAEFTIDGEGWGDSNYPELYFKKA